MVELTRIVSFLDDYLETKNFAEDQSCNGLQVQGKKEVKKIAFAVDACIRSIESASRQGADMLFVHHGLLWNKVNPITVFEKNRLKPLFDSDISLYGVHLPLDAHEEVGNNIELARIFGLGKKEFFGTGTTKPLGCFGNLEKPLKAEEFAAVVSEKLGSKTILEKNGKDIISRVGIVSGGGSGYVSECADLGIDCLVTGESTLSAVREAEERNIAMIFAGHYATETVGVKAVMKKIKEVFPEIETVFIDLQTDF
ncbi:MAG: Nif3-like dinuclear metal center hexameric protein [Candidatus Diapherotrites archaeon]|nr:Nif3-like dinuclear metal center hexameric protein [Candidatus Diapherotrites archaeon]